MGILKIYIIGIILDLFYKGVFSHLFTNTDRDILRSFVWPMRLIYWIGDKFGVILQKIFNK